MSEIDPWTKILESKSLRDTGSKKKTWTGNEEDQEWGLGYMGRLGVKWVALGHINGWVGQQHWSRGQRLKLQTVHVEGDSRVWDGVSGN